MKNLIEYIMESRKVSTLKKAWDTKDFDGFKFYKIGHDLNGNPLWCIKQDDTNMTKEQANSIGFRKNTIKDENGKKIYVWTCQSYNIGDTYEHIKKLGVELI